MKKLVSSPRYLLKSSKLYALQKKQYLKSKKNAPKSGNTPIKGFVEDSVQTNNSIEFKNETIQQGSKTWKKIKSLAHSKIS